MRVLLAGGTLLLPTTLMGATLPLILKHFVRSRSVLGELGAYFYAVNTLGALAGTLLAGFALLPYLGMTRSTWSAAAINLGIGSICVALGWNAILPRTAPHAARPELDPLPGLDPVARRRIAGGAIALASRGSGRSRSVAWTRILLISFSATVYRSGDTALPVRIFLGSRMISRVVDQQTRWDCSRC
jgi:spermidine synthase